jgi:hypothetical protein
MSDEVRWYFCLKHSRVEQGPGCPGRHRLGPYPTEDAAANALERARERTEEWEAEEDD